MRISSDSEKPVRRASRRLVDWLKSSHGTKVPSLVDKIYHPENLRVAWRKVKANRGSGGIDGESLEDFEEELEANLQRLHEELRDKTYRPAPVREHLIPKAGKPGKDRKLGIPTVYDRVCQQAIKNRLEPIFEEVFDGASFGYRPRRSAWDAVDTVTKEIGGLFHDRRPRQADGVAEPASVRWARAGADREHPQGRCAGQRWAAAFRAGYATRRCDLTIAQ
jgi:hypothetical protein